jgi:hypothetical protein
MAGVAVEEGSGGKNMQRVLVAILILATVTHAALAGAQPQLPGVFTVRVVGPTGPMGGVTVRLTNATGQMVGMGTTASDGTYVFVGLPEGTYTASASLKNVVLGTAADAITATVQKAAVTITIEAGDAASTRTSTVAISTALITAALVLATGLAGVAGAVSTSSTASPSR